VTLATGRQVRAQDSAWVAAGTPVDPHTLLISFSLSNTHLNNSLEKEDFSRTERRKKAEAYLGSPELLMMYAQSTEDVSCFPTIFRSSPNIPS